MTKTIHIEDGLFTVGSGTGILIGFRDYGLGDMLCAMPALQWAYDNNIPVTVACHPVSQYLVESVGAKFVDINSILVGQWKVLADQHARAYSMNEWSVWHERQTKDMSIDRFEQFALITGLELPEKFSWYDKIKPNLTDDRGEYVVLACDSSTRYRTYFQKWKLYNKLRKQYNVVVLGIDESNFELPFFPNSGIGSNIYQKAKNLVREFAYELKSAFKSQINEERSKAKKFFTENEDRSGIQQLADCIYNAKFVVGTDNGVVMLANALGVPTVGLWGITAPKHISDQFAKYVSGERINLTSKKDFDCEQPCYGHASKGFDGELCLGKHSVAKCMESITPKQILHTIQTQL